MFTRAIGLVGILALFIGSIGIPMYAHYCSHEQLTIHTLFSASNHCDTETSGHEDKCCKPPKEQGIKRKNCCSNELKNLSLSFDYFQYKKSNEVHLMAVLTDVSSVYVSFSTIPDAGLWHFPEMEDPPPLGVHDRLPLVGCWRL